MPYIITDKWYTPELARANPDFIFVFGDNVKRVGCGGQAVLRYEPNTYGVATKLDPAHFFSDASIDDLDEMRMDIGYLCKMLDGGQKIVLPKGGLGTGLSDMPNQCPNLFKLLEAYLEFINTNYEELEDSLKEATIYEFKEL